MSVLRARGLGVSYAGVVALHDVNLEVAPGQLLAVTGPSGAGKTSLLWALAGALTPTTGSVRLGDTEIAGRDHAARLGVAVVPQGNGLATGLTAGENVLAALLGLGIGAAEARRRVVEALVLVGLEDSAQHLIEELSGGQQQRVALARALGVQGTVLLADEPTSDLDAGNRERAIAALRQQADRGAVVVMATHDPEAAAQTDGELGLDEGGASWVRRLSERAEVAGTRAPGRHRRHP